MSHCKNCRYWEEDEYLRYGAQTEVKCCTKAESLGDASHWVELDHERPSLRVLKESYKDTLFFVKRDSYIDHVLYTRAEFGCVAFVEKQQ